MINSSLFQEALSEYKQLLPRLFDGYLSREKIKWETLKGFERNWNMNVHDFTGMLKRTVRETGGLLAGCNNNSWRMIEVFAEKSPEEVRAMFRSLFDESMYVSDRIYEFQQTSADLLKRFGDGAANHYQSETAVTTYLWLWDPDKYYVFKFDEVKAVAEKLGTNYIFIQGDFWRNIENFYAFYDEIYDELMNDHYKLRALLDLYLDDNCYRDPEFITLTMDFGLYVSRYFDRRRS